MVEESKPPGGKGTLRRELIERGGSHEVRYGGSTEGWYEEFEPTGGKGTLRRELIERGGSHEVRYGGGHGSRTRDPDVANVVLSQLS